MNGSRADPIAQAAHLLIVGAGPGIAAGVARRFAREGCRLTLVSRDRGRLDDVAEPLRAAGATVRLLSADAGDPYALRAALQSAVAADPPSVVVYNAARGEREDLLASDGRALQSAYAVNVVGAIVTAQLVAPAMRAAAAGTIVFTGVAAAADGGTLALGTQSLRAVAEILAEQLTPSGVHVAYAAIAGPVDAGGELTPDLVGDAYWRIHAQSRAGWRTVYRVGGAQDAD